MLKRTPTPGNPVLRLAAWARHLRPFAGSGQSLSVDLTGQIALKFYFIPSVPNAALPSTVSFNNDNNAIMCSGSDLTMQWNYPAPPYNNYQDMADPGLALYDGTPPANGYAWYWNPYQKYSLFTLTPNLGAGTPLDAVTYTGYSYGGYTSYNGTQNSQESGCDVSCTSDINETFTTYAATGTIMYNGVLSTYIGMADNNGLDNGGPLVYTCTESLTVPQNISQMSLGGAYGSLITLPNNGAVTTN
jgi:hypothetical protein